MRSRILAAALGGACLLVAPSPAPAAATDCGGIPARKITRLKADGASCATARTVAKAWDRSGKKVKGFGCGYLPVGDNQVEKVICRKDSARITFKKRWVGTMPFPTYPPIQAPSANSG